jgi:hypothetical protein
MEDYDAGSECLSLLKPGFGLKDAPRLWNLAIGQVLGKAGLKPTNTDHQLYVKHRNGRLVLLLSIHVDDLKITGEKDEIKTVLALLTSSFDELKIETNNFEHLGLKHTLEQDGSRTLSQEHYISELKFIPEADCRNDNPLSLVKIPIYVIVRWCGMDRADSTRHSCIHSCVAAQATVASWKRCHSPEQSFGLSQTQAFEVHLQKG